MRKYVIELCEHPRSVGLQYPSSVFDRYRGQEIESLDYYTGTREEGIKSFIRAFGGLSATLGKNYGEQITIISKKKFFEQMFADFRKLANEITFDQFCGDSNAVYDLQHCLGCGLNPSDWYVLHGSEIIHVDEFLRRFCCNGSIFYVGNIFTAKI